MIQSKRLNTDNFLKNNHSEEIKGALFSYSYRHTGRLKGDLI